MTPALALAPKLTEEGRSVFHPRCKFRCFSLQAVASVPPRRARRTACTPPNFRMPKGQPVPHFTPTAEEWSAGFAAFVRKISPQIEAYGGCTITPPASWAWSTPALDLTQAVKPIRQHLFRAGSGMRGCYTGIFEEAAPMPLSEYMALAERNQPSSGSRSEPSSADPEEVQSQFWRRVVTGEQGVMYGSDTDAASLFDPALAEWNLSRLPAGTERCSKRTERVPNALKV